MLHYTVTLSFTVLQHTCRFDVLQYHHLICALRITPLPYPHPVCAFWFTALAFGISLVIYCRTIWFTYLYVYTYVLGLKFDISIGLHYNMTNLYWPESLGICRVIHCSKLHMVDIDICIYIYTYIFTTLNSKKIYDYTITWLKCISLNHSVSTVWSIVVSSMLLLYIYTYTYMYIYISMYMGWNSRLHCNALMHKWLHQSACMGKLIRTLQGGEDP